MYILHSKLSNSKLSISVQLVQEGVLREGGGRHSRSGMLLLLVLLVHMLLRRSRR